MSETNQNSNKANFWRAATTLGVWVFAIAALALISIEMAPTIGEDSLGAVFMVMIAVVVSTGFIWDWGQTGNQAAAKKDAQAVRNLLAEQDMMAVGGKRKRDRLAVALSQLSDGELLDLRTRLQTGEITEDDLEYVLRESERL